MSKEGSIFQRVEKKYQMDQRQYEAFLKAAENRIHMDEFGLHTINNISNFPQGFCHVTSNKYGISCN